MATNPPPGWDLARRREYFDWAKQVIDALRGVRRQLEALFDAAYAARPQSVGPPTCLPTVQVNARWGSDRGTRRASDDRRAGSSSRALAQPKLLSEMGPQL